MVLTLKNIEHNKTQAKGANEHKYHALIWKECPYRESE